MKQINKETASQRTIVRLPVQVPKPCYSFAIKMLTAHSFSPLSPCTKFPAGLQEAPEPVLIPIHFSLHPRHHDGEKVKVRRYNKMQLLCYAPVPDVPKICIICDVMTMSNCNWQFSSKINNNPMCGVALVIKTCVIQHCKMYL